jgi:Asp/Glu/hydantoin racemase
MTTTVTREVAIPRQARADHLLGRVQPVEREPGSRPRLMWIESTEARPGLSRLWTFLDQYLKEISGPEFETSNLAFPIGGGGVRQPAARLLTETLAVAVVAEVESQADLFILNDMAQPFYPLRALISKPITGIMEASVVLGNVLARRPAIITVTEGLRPGMERDMWEMGLLGRMANPAVWWLDPPTTHEEIQSPDSLMGRFDEVAHRAVAAGADAILVGCGYYGPVFAKHGYTHVTNRPDVPVYDCARLGLEMARTLYSLHVAGVNPSLRGFPRLPQPNARAAREMLARIIEGG